ncbi:MAG: DUF2934 domain-containing protein [Spirochaetales bacterium]
MAKKSEGTTKKRGKSASNSPPLSPEKLENEIRERAEEIYLRRISTGEPGDELSDWLTAETEVKQKYRL